MAVRDLIILSCTWYPFPLSYLSESTLLKKKMYLLHGDVTCFFNAKMPIEKRKLLQQVKSQCSYFTLHLRLYELHWLPVRIFTARLLYQCNNYTCFSSADTTADCTPLRAGSNLPLCLENIQYFHKQPPSTTQRTLPTPRYGLEIKKKKEEKIPCWDSGAKLWNVA